MGTPAPRVIAKADLKFVEDWSVKHNLLIVSIFDRYKCQKKAVLLSLFTVLNGLKCRGIKRLSRVLSWCESCQWQAEVKGSGFSLFTFGPIKVMVLAYYAFKLRSGQYPCLRIRLPYEAAEKP